MPRTTKENEEIRASRRASIIEAATRVFAEKGVTGTKVKDIAEAAQLSHGLLYHYFDSKEAVVEALVDELIARAERELDLRHPRAADRLAAAMTRHRERLESDLIDVNNVVMQALVQAQALSEGAQRRLQAHVERVTAMVEGWIAQGQAEGDLDDRLDPAELTRVLVYLFHGMSIRWPPCALPLPRADTLMTLLRARSPASTSSDEDDRS